MAQSRHTIRGIGHCAMVLMVSMWLLAAAARAAAPNWMVNGAEMGAGAKKALAGTLVGESNLLSNTLKKMLRITCTTVTPNATINTGGTITGSVEFTKCKTFYGGKENDIHTTPTEALAEQAACKPKEPIVVAGKGSLASHEGTHLIKLEPNIGAPLATIVLGPECAAGEEFEVKGSMFVKDAEGNGSFLTEKTSHAFKEDTVATLSLGGLKFGANTASLDGTVSLSLTSGEKWSGLVKAPTPIHVESCMGEGTECKTASVGTTFTATSSNFVIQSGEEEHEGESKVNKCSLVESGKVVDPTSEKPGDLAEVSLTSIEFSKCTGPALTAKSLPWTSSADTATFEGNREFEWDEWLLETFLGCKYKTNNEDDLMFRRWDTSPTLLLDLGHVVYEEGPWYCYALRSVEASLEFTGVSDPNLGGASTLIVK